MTNTKAIAIEETRNSQCKMDGMLLLSIKKRSNGVRHVAHHACPVAIWVASAGFRHLDVSESMRNQFRGASMHVLNKGNRHYITR